LGYRLRPAPAIKELWWSPPTPEWTKINTNGSAAGSLGPASYEGVFRRYRCCCFTSPLSIPDVFEAKLFGFKALEVAQSNYWFSLWIEAGSVYLVELVRNHSRDVLWRFHVAWTRSLELLEFILFYVSHVYREGNQLAGCLVSNGSFRFS